MTFTRAAYSPSSMKPVPLMNRQLTFAFAALSLLLSACDRGPVEVNQLVRQQLSVHPAPEVLDTTARLLPTGSAGSGQLGPGRYTATRPADWQAIPPRSEFYLMSFDVSGGVRCDVAVTGGGLEGNLQRWFNQFEDAAWPNGGLSSFAPITLAQFDGYLVELEGRYSPGMGSPAQGQAALLGAAAADATGTGAQTITVKMTGPAAAVAAQRENFLAFCSSLAAKS